MNHLFVVVEVGAVHAWKKCEGGGRLSSKDGECGFHTSDFQRFFALHRCVNFPAGKEKGGFVSQKPSYGSPQCYPNIRTTPNSVRVTHKDASNFVPHVL
jgi:hypothetical protein